MAGMRTLPAAACIGSSDMSSYDIVIVGHGLAELVACGGYRSLDLSELSPVRLRDGRTVRERTIV